MSMHIVYKKEMIWMRKIVIEGNAVYEIDEECLRRKAKKAKQEKQEKEEKEEGQRQEKKCL